MRIANALLLAAMATAISAEVIDFDMVLSPDHMIWRRVPMYGVAGSPATGSVSRR